MTLETLRELADLLAIAAPDRTDAEKARAHADAWEADLSEWHKDIDRWCECITALQDANKRLEVAAWKHGEAVSENVTLRKRLEAADLTIGTLQADRIKAQATIDHYRAMLGAAEEALRKYGDHMTYCKGNMDAPCTCGYHEVCKPAVKRMEGRQAWLDDAALAQTKEEKP